jgi:hypothetical protein
MQGGSGTPHPAGPPHLLGRMRTFSHQLALESRRHDTGLDNLGGALAGSSPSRFEDCPRRDTAERRRNLTNGCPEVRSGPFRSGPWSRTKTARQIRTRFPDSLSAPPRVRDRLNPPHQFSRLMLRFRPRLAHDGWLLRIAPTGALASTASRISARAAQRARRFSRPTATTRRNRSISPAGRCWIAARLTGQKAPPTRRSAASRVKSRELQCRVFVAPIG